MIHRYQLWLYIKIFICLFLPLFFSLSEMHDTSEIRNSLVCQEWHCKDCEPVWNALFQICLHWTFLCKNENFGNISCSMFYFVGLDSLICFSCSNICHSWYFMNTCFCFCFLFMLVIELIFHQILPCYVLFLLCQLSFIPMPFVISIFFLQTS